MTIPVANAQVIGCDYGVKPRVIIMGNIEFLEMLRSSLLALGYGRLPTFKLLVNAPFLGMAFNDDEVARRCFSIFKSWADASEDGDALSLSFIELEDGENGFCVYPETDRLVRRMVPERQRDEIEPLVFSAGYLKVFPAGRSSGYVFFRAATENSPFVLFPVAGSGALMEFAFVKREVRFFKESEIREDSVEGSLLAARRGKLEDAPRPRPVVAQMTRSDVAARRRRQLSRFFPVTLERLHLDADFISTCRAFQARGYMQWQVEQAACTLILRHRVPDLFCKSQTEDKAEPSTLEILDYLLSNQEDVMERPIPASALDQYLQDQIAADSAELLAYFMPDGHQLSTDCQCELSKHDLLRG